MRFFFLLLKEDKAPFSQGLAHNYELQLGNLDFLYFIQKIEIEVWWCDVDFPYFTSVREFSAIEYQI